MAKCPGCPPSNSVLASWSNWQPLPSTLSEAPKSTRIATLVRGRIARNLRTLPQQLPAAETPNRKRLGNWCISNRLQCLGSSEPVEQQLPHSWRLSSENSWREGHQNCRNCSDGSSAVEFVANVTQFNRIQRPKVRQFSWVDSAESMSRSWCRVSVWAFFCQTALASSCCVAGGG